MKSFHLDSDQIDAIVRGLHDNPFAVLGMHAISEGAKSGLVVRTFIPYVASVSIVHSGNGKTFEMTRIHDAGLYEAVIPSPKKPFPYTYSITASSGDVRSQSDPYAFGSTISDFDLQLWGEGNHHDAHTFMGAHLMEMDGISGTRFVVCAPAAKRVSVVGAFNGWDGRVHVMRRHFNQGIWEIFVPGVSQGAAYKYEIATHTGNLPMTKADPYATFAELRPGTASIVYNTEQYKWNDSKWMKNRTSRFNEPVSIYEIHLGSWRRKGEDKSLFLTYREAAEQLIGYVKDLGYTHIELLPVAEHPYDPSWGYQVTGYFAPTSRFGTPDDFMFFVDECHRNGIGVIVDWVPAHFTKDDHGLRYFDGTHLYEHADPRQGEHKDWGTNIFNFGRSEVMNFLISNAVYWLDRFHIDGLRVDAVASMLYLDYSRKEGEWVPNKYGGRENLEAIQFIKRFNEVVHDRFTGVMTMAEESTSWPMVSRPTYLGGLGFDYKWNMGWMNDTLKYIEVDPLFRRYHHNSLTFSMIYAFSENFVLPFSHDEVVHLKRSMLDKMPGDLWQKFANLRLLYSYMYAHPGKKLGFMGSEFGQWSEWNSHKELDWSLLGFESHRGVTSLVRDLNGLYSREKALHEVDFDWKGFKWINPTDYENSTISFVRFAEDPSDFIVCLFNFTPVVREAYTIGVPEPGTYDIIFNSDSHYYGGSNVGLPALQANPGEWHGFPAHVSVSVPPLGAMYLKPKKA
jgi:1,4-alpha-glucan branching enzyme